MSKMTIVQLGVIFFAICLSTQVVSQNSTMSPETGNATSNSTPTATTMALTNTSTSTTKPTGSGLSLNAGTGSFLVPVITAASLLQRYC